MLFRQHGFRSALITLGLVIVTGCSDPYGGRREVSGDVKFQGQPLQNGSILFVPLEGQDTQSGGPIVNGAYQVPRANGLKPGSYLVRVSSGDGKTPASEETAAAPGGSTNIVSRDLIPAEWNTRSAQTIVVKADGDNRFHFDIPQINTPNPKR